MRCVFTSSISSSHEQSGAVRSSMQRASGRCSLLLLLLLLLLL
jgi:hypothetical protein